MRTILHLSPFLLLIAALSGCGGSVVGTGGGGGSATTTTTGTGATGTTTTTTGTGSFDACTGPGQCTLVSSGCCGGCGIPTLDSMTAVNADQADDYFKEICPVPVPCPLCDPAPNPNLFAYCEAGHCTGADVTTHDVSACSTNADCRLRNGAACCEACLGSAEQLVAVSVGSDLVSLVCGPDEGCPKCLPQYPLDAAAICDGGHCAVVFAGSAGGG